MDDRRPPTRVPGRPDEEPGQGHPVLERDLEGLDRTPVQRRRPRHRLRLAVEVRPQPLVDGGAEQGLVGGAVIGAGPQVRVAGAHIVPRGGAPLSGLEQPVAVAVHSRCHSSNPPAPTRFDDLLAFAEIGGAVGRLEQRPGAERLPDRVLAQERHAISAVGICPEAQLTEAISVNDSREAWLRGVPARGIHAGEAEEIDHPERSARGPKRRLPLRLRDEV